MELKKYYLKAFGCRRIDLNRGNGIGGGRRARRRSPRPGPSEDREDLTIRRRFEGAVEEHVGGQARITRGAARVEHVVRGAGASLPRLESLDGALQVAARDNALVYVCGITPRDGEGPVARPVVADGLLHQPGVVGRRRPHQVARGLRTVHLWINWGHHVEVVEGHEREFGVR